MAGEQLKEQQQFDTKDIAATLEGGVKQDDFSNTQHKIEQNKSQTSLEEKQKNVFSYLKKYNQKIEFNYDDGDRSEVQKIQNRKEGATSYVGISYYEQGHYITKRRSYNEVYKTHEITTIHHHDNVISKAIDWSFGTSTERKESISPSAAQLEKFLNQVQDIIGNHEDYLRVQESAKFEKKLKNVDSLPLPEQRKLLNEVLQKTGTTPEREMSSATLKARTVLYHTVSPDNAVSENTDTRAQQMTSILDTAMTKLKDSNYKPKELEREFSTPQAEDMRLFYLGLPQKYGSIGVSDYAPSQTKDGTNKIYYKINNPKLKATLRSKLIEPEVKDLNEIRSYDDSIKLLETELASLKRNPSENKGKIAALKYDLQYIKDRIAAKNSLPISIPKYSEYKVFNPSLLLPHHVHSSNFQDTYPSVKEGEWADALRGLGNFTLTKGVDSKGSYISYYDKYDFHLPGWTPGGGRPFELYDRMYYNPTTMEPLDPEVNNILNDF